MTSIELFNDKAYALHVWSPKVIAYCEEVWENREFPADKLDLIIPGGNQNVLDVGCGIGAYYNLLARKANKYVGVDITDNMVKRARELHSGGDFRVESIFNLPFSKESFDLVFCLDVLIHFPYDMVEHLIGKLCWITRKYLFLSMYIGAGESTTKGSFDEYITTMSEHEMKDMFDRLSNFSLKGEWLGVSSKAYLLEIGKLR